MIYYFLILLIYFSGTMQLTDIKEWQRKRRRTFNVYLVQALLHGVEFSIVQGSLWVYLKSVIGNSERKLWYAVINASVFVWPIFAGSFIGKWIDKTRRVQLCLLICNWFILIGTCLYILPFSPFLLLGGRILQGLNYTVRSIMISETARSYSDEELLKKINSLFLCKILGEFFGSLINMIFHNVDFWIGSLHFTYGNIPSLSLVFLFSIQIVLTICYSYDLSHDFDVKSKKTTLLDAESTPTDRKIITSWMDGLKNIPYLKVAILLAMTFQSGGQLIIFPRILPVIIQNLGYNDNIVNVYLAGVSVTNMIIVLLMIKLEVSNAEVYYCGIIHLLSFIFACIAIILISNELNVYFNSLLLGINLFSFSVFIATRTFQVFTLNKLYDSANQSFHESIRMSASLLGRLITALASPYIYDYFSYFAAENILITIAFLVFMFVKKNSLCKELDEN